MSSSPRVIVGLSGSVALAADTIHNFSDALTAIPLWIEVRAGQETRTAADVSFATLERRLLPHVRRFARELEVSLEEGREVVERKVHEVLVLLTTSLKGSAAKALVRERGPLPIWFTGPLPKGVVVRERALAEAHLLVNARELRFVTVWKEAVNAR
jgi:hypothetical protein